MTHLVRGGSSAARRPCSRLEYPTLRRLAVKWPEASEDPKVAFGAVPSSSAAGVLGVGGVIQDSHQAQDVGVGAPEHDQLQARHEALTAVALHTLDAAR